MKYFNTFILAISITLFVSLYISKIYEKKSYFLRKNKNEIPQVEKDQDKESLNVPNQKIYLTIVYRYLLLFIFSNLGYKQLYSDVKTYFESKYDNIEIVGYVYENYYFEKVFIL
jgi:hypothetical protein